MFQLTLLIWQLLLPLSSGNIEKSLCWKVSLPGSSKVSYLYGTMHSDDEAVRRFAPEMLNAFDQCQVFACEVDVGEVTPGKYVGMTMMKDSVLSDLYSDEDWELVNKALGERLEPMYRVMIMKMKPFYAMEIFTTGDQLVIDSTVDAILAMRAHRLDKKIVALETVEEAGEAIDQIALKTQAELLMKVILNPEEEKELESTMLRLYTEQDLDGMEELYFESDVPGIVTEAIVYQRNRKFSEQLISLMKRKSVFCAVGALHLPGETGLIKSLRNAGFTVEPFYFEWKN